VIGRQVDRVSENGAFRKVPDEVNDLLTIKHID